MNAQSLIAIDPGTEKSGVVLLDFRFGQPIWSPGILDNKALLAELRRGTFASALFAIEQIRSYGMAIGATTLDTVEWSGRFIEAWQRQTGCGDDSVLRIPRIQVKSRLCHSGRAKDSNVRQALIDRFGEPGTKYKPGVLYGISSHLWSALAVGVVAKDMLAEKESAGKEAGHGTA